MASTIKEILLSDFCSLLSFSAFEVEEALQLLKLFNFPFWYRILTLFLLKEFFKN